jgi:outer membrane lipoprotein LolB
MPAPRGEGRSRLIRTLASACALLALCACAPSAVRPGAEGIRFPIPRSTFEAEGRLSARHGAQAFSANFRWQHADDRDALEFSSPLGQTVAVLSGDAAGVQFVAADGRRATAGDWVTLTEAGLGWRLPVGGLAFWIQGAPRAGAPYSAEPGNDGRAAVLRQDGWTIVYLAYAPGEDAAPRPARMTLEYPEIELRLVVDAWR